MIALEQHSVYGLEHGHRSVTGQQVHHHALVARIEMLDEDESHAVPGGQRLDELSAGIEAARRGAYPDDQEIVPAPRRAARWHRSPTRAGTRRFDLGWTPFGHFTGSLRKCSLVEQVAPGYHRPSSGATRTPGTWLAERVAGLRSFRACS